jgi:hydrogenase assembly chaperone HypC/HupF
VNRSALSLDACGGQHCVTCSDEGLPMSVVRVDEARGLALCRGDDGARQSVEIALVEPVAVGQVLLVHAGTAIARLDSGDRAEVVR